MQERSIPFYASQLRITPHHLSALIKKASGQSVMYWINRATIQEAKLLLKTNGMMAYEIANRMKGTSSELCHWLHFFRSMSNADGQTGAVFLLVKSGWARCPA